MSAGMNGWWSDQDRGRESDLSAQGTSEGESESFEDGSPRLEEQRHEGRATYQEPTDSKEMMDSPNGAFQVNRDQSEEEAADDDSLQPLDGEVTDEEEDDEPGNGNDGLGASGQTLVSLADDEEDVAVGAQGQKRHTVLNMHHVDLILDNIDAELNEIINRSLSSEHSEHSFHGSGTHSGRTGAAKKAQIRTGPALVESSDEATPDDQPDDDESASDTGLGTGSHPGDSSPLPAANHTHQGSALGSLKTISTAGNKRMNSNKGRPNGYKKNSKRQMVVEVSDVDSISSEDVRLRMEETLNLQDSDTDTLPSRHSHNPSHSHDALPNHYGPPVPVESAVHNPYGSRRGEPGEVVSDQSEVSCDSEDREQEEISSRIQEMVSLVLTDSKSDEPLFEEAASSPEYDYSRHSKDLPKQGSIAGRTKGARNTRGRHGGAQESRASNGPSFLEHRRAGRGADADSIATEDFEHVFQESLVQHRPSSDARHRNSPARTPGNRIRGPRAPPAAPSSPAKIDHLTVPVMGKRGRSKSKKRSITMATSKPSGLPEFMYLRKGVTESDVGSDSIRTEDYEGHFEVARVIDQHSSPHHYANTSNIPPRGRAVNVHSDPESIQTEEYEQRFRSLMVKQLAGVPVQSFDQVTIASDLESVETGMVHQRFQEALRQGPEVRLFNEFGDQSDLDPVQMEEVERKFQAIRRQKKIEKMRHSHRHDGDTDDEGTSDLDSVRAIPSKSEAGSPPSRHAVDRRSADQSQHNDAYAKPNSRSQDASQRGGAYGSARSSSSPRVPRTPVHSQLTSPRMEAGDAAASPGPPQQSPAANPYVNHGNMNAERSEQAKFPSWQDQSVGRQRAAAWNAQRQDSLSTYEEVESLNSHQCSSVQSLDNSCVPSRLQSFGSTNSSLDQSLPQVDGVWNHGTMHKGDNFNNNQRDDQDSSLDSESLQSVSVEGGQAGQLKEKFRRSIIEDDDEMNSSVAKWVDQTRAETARRRSHVGLPEEQPVRSHEAPVGSQSSCSATKERSLTALNMQCGDVIPGKSGRELELALRVGNASPVSMISRGVSIDSTHSSAGSDHPKSQQDWTMAEGVLINLGFGGCNIGIPDRFLRSWREQAQKQRVDEVRRLLGNTSSHHLLQKLPTKPEKTASWKEKKSSLKKENQSSPNAASVPLESLDSGDAQPAESLKQPKSLNSPQVEDDIMSRQRGADKAKLIGLRRSLKKAATVSSFGQALADVSKQGPPNQPVTAAQQMVEQPPAARRSPGGGKYSPFHKTHKSSARDRRRKYMKKQSSLPISLETLQEEDEGLKPGLVVSKPVDSESLACQKHLLRPQSLEDGDEPAFHCKLKIVMEQPSVESREAMSRQGTTDVDVDEAIADVDMEKKNLEVSMEQYLVVKAIIDSKDSGFENDASRTGSPQISPRSSEEETVRGTGSKTVTTADSGLEGRSKSSEYVGGTTDSLLVIGPSCTTSKQSSNPEDASQEPNRNKAPNTCTAETPEIPKPSKAIPEPNIAPDTGTRGNNTKGRSSSASSERIRGPSLGDVQDDFHQAIFEDVDDVFEPLVESQQSVSACCQTSPTLHSPLLSPLFFLGSFREHPDETLEDRNPSCNSSDIMSMPGQSGTASHGRMRQGSSMEKGDSLESIMTTADCLITKLLPTDLSQEISDGGLSIIAEKEEECSDHTAASDKGKQDDQELSPMIKITNKAANVSQNIFKFDERDQNVYTLSQTTSGVTEKSRNPFKSSNSFYSSPHHSKVGFDFDATIEEDENGEHYSDGESFSRVTFSEMSPMIFQPENLTFLFPHQEINDSPEILSEFTSEYTEQMNTCDNIEDKSVTGDNFSESNTVQGIAKPAQKKMTFNDLKVNSHPGNVFTSHNNLITENGFPSVAEITQALSGVSHVGNGDGTSNVSDNCLLSRFQAHDDLNLSPGAVIAEEENPSKINERVEATVSAVSSGNESQFTCERQSGDEPPAITSPKSVNVLDSTAPSQERANAETIEASVLNPENCVHGKNAFQTGSALRNGSHVQPVQPPELKDCLQGKKKPLIEWKHNFGQPQIMRSTSVEAHLNFQRKKLRTLSERSTLYSDGMEPLLSSFGRGFTERSGATTEVFGSFGSDVFRRPLTVTQTLQQVAAKLESHIRQRTLLSIQDEEAEGHDGQNFPDDEETLAKQACTKEKLPVESDSINKTAVPSKEKSKYPLKEDDCQEGLNCKVGYVISACPEEDSPKEMSNEKEFITNSNIPHENVQNDRNLFNHDNIQGKLISGMLHFCPAVGVENISPDRQVALSTKPNIQDLITTSSSEDSGNAKKKDIPEITDKTGGRPFQASSGRPSSTFLSIPSFGPLNDSMDASSLASSSSSASPRAECIMVEPDATDVDENIPPGSENPNPTQSMDRPKYQDILPEPEPSDEGISLLHSSEAGSLCGLGEKQRGDGKALVFQDKPMHSTDLENEASDDDLNVRAPMASAAIVKKNALTSVRSLSPFSQHNQANNCHVANDVKNTTQDANKHHSMTSELSLSNGHGADVDKCVKKPHLAGDLDSVRHLPPKWCNPMPTVVHSQFYRCEMFVEVSKSSDGKVDFVESTGRDGNGAPRQIPTFLSEVHFFPRHQTLQSPRERNFNCSQTSSSLDCPSPVQTPRHRHSPTFEEICSKAGNLMHRLQDTLASDTPGAFQWLPAEMDEREGDVDRKDVDQVDVEEEEVEEGEAEKAKADREGQNGSRDQAYPQARDDGHHHQPSTGHHRPYDLPRVNQGTRKRRNKRLRDDGVIKTSTPKMNNTQGSRHRQNGSLEVDRHDRKEAASQDHVTTIRELLETETNMRRKLDELESSFEEVSSQKQVALSDLKELREAVHRNKRDIQKAEEIARESIERADGLRSELMVLEYQRDQASRDLQDLTQSIDAVQHQPHRRGLSEEETAGTSNGMLGLSPKEVIAVIQERDDLKMRVRNGEGDLSPIERSELERQLNSTKQELFNGQKSSRAKVEALEEDLEESHHRMEELLLEKTSLAERVKELQAVISSEQCDQRLPHMEERNKLLEQLNGKLQKELDALRLQCHEKDQRLLTMTALVSERDKLNGALKEKVAEMQTEGMEQGRESERRVKEAEGKVRNADVVKQLALVELRETLLREKDEELEQLKLSLEKDKKESLTALDDKTSEVLTITKHSLSEKEEDLKAVKLQLVEQREEADKMEQRLKEQAEEQTKAAVAKERSEREEEYTRRRREETVEKELELAKETSRLQGELHVTRQRLEHNQTTLAVLKEELDKLREMNLAAGREKVEAVSEAREKAREDIQRELDQLREQLAKENLLEVDKLRMKQRQQEEELTKLRAEVKGHRDKDARAASSVTDSRSILAEITEECKRTAAVISSTPLPSNLSSIKGSKSLNGTLSPKHPLLSSTPKSSHSPGRTQVMAALTNLRISNEQLRNHAQTLKADLDRQKRAASKAQKQKDEEVKKVADTIEKKSEDMETMRDRLIQDHLSQVGELQQQLSHQRTAESSLQQHLMDKDSELREIQQSMTQWKEETALKMAKKFEEELGKELEIRLQETSKRDGSSYRGSQSDLRSKHSSSDNLSASPASSASDASTIRLLRHLQERVKQLRTENLSLRRSSRGPYESSSEERASPHSSNGSNDKDHLLYQLQQRVKLLERQLQVAEERCRQHAVSASEKSSENNRLQGALTQQTKELMKMERAYSKLATPPRTPIRL